VVGRALAFSSPDNIALARDRFVPVAGDEWYYRRRRDPEGEFFRRIADQGPRRDRKRTRQGIYVFSAGGTFLAYQPGDALPEQIRSTLMTALEAWKRLPEEDRRPAGLPAREPLDRRYAHTPPEGGIIVRVHARILDRGADGRACAARAAVHIDQRTVPPLAQYDHLWLTRSEWRSLVPADGKPGPARPVPLEIARRILRFHLVDNTRGEPAYWRPRDVRSSFMTVRVVGASAAGVSVRLDGAALLATDADAARAERGFAVRLLGHLHYDAVAGELDRFDLVALGDHWGDGPYTAGSRKGRSPLGVAFELVRGATEVDRIPPHAARDIDGYFSASSPVERPAP
jgi:hypothetical protein